MTGNFEFAPPAMVVDGINAVPIDISLVEATIGFDVAAATASVDVTVHFELGVDGGCPIFDLRQPITTSWLDGAPIAVGLLAHHDFGGGAGAKMRVLNSPLAAGSAHTLRLQYALGQPDAAQSEPIGFNGSRLSFDFWFTDLHPGRYLEMWLPANLIWDQFELRLDVSVVGTATDHTPITNGAMTVVGPNHWEVAYPSWWNASCPMLVIEATDRLAFRTGSVDIAGFGTIDLEMSRHTSVSTSLTSVESALQTLLADFAGDIGTYLHGNRFVAHLWNSTRAMEYAGSTTTNFGALGHEAFHSWFARGVLPANGHDGWFDEAITSWMTGGQPSNPLGLSESVSTLCARNRYVRATPSASYSRGRDVFSGLADVLGVNNVVDALAAIYGRYRGRQLTTEQLEAELIIETGQMLVADYFQRYVYGLPDLGAGHDLWLRDAVGDPGLNEYAGSRFWDSPDLWVRNQQDTGTVHQPPEFGQDNWLHARVRNRGTSTARHFVVTFNPTVFAGSQFVYPADWLPPIAAAVGFDLAPGSSTVVSARWPRATIPANGTHACLLASVFTTTDPPISGRRTWEHNNLAQKNLTVVDLEPNAFYMLDFQIGSMWFQHEQQLLVELRRPRLFPEAPAAILSHDPKVIDRLLADPRRAAVGRTKRIQPAARLRVLGSTRVVSAGITVEMAPASSFLVAPRGVPEFDAATMQRGTALLGNTAGRRGAGFAAGTIARLPLPIRPRETARVALRVQVPKSARPGATLQYDVLQRDVDGDVIGGVTLQVNVVSPATKRK